MSRTIGQLANELNINIETIRYYERRGLIQQPVKPDTGYRHYSDAIANRIRFIKRSQELGFTLHEIISLLSLNDSPCHQVQELAQNKLLSVQQKIESLHSLEASLKSLLSQCQNNQDTECCPVIDSLQS